MIVIRNPSSAYTDSRVQYSNPESRTVLAAKLTCSVFLFDYLKFSVKPPLPAASSKSPLFSGLRKLITPPPHPSPNYSSLINDRLY